MSVSDRAGAVTGITVGQNHHTKIVNSMESVAADGYQFILNKHNQTLNKRHSRGLP